MYLILILILILLKFLMIHTRKSGISTKLYNLKIRIFISFKVN